MTTVVPTQEELGTWLYNLTQLTDHWRETQWEIADQLKAGIDRLSSRYAVAELYRLASETMGVSVKTLQNLVSVARRFPPEDRQGDLSPSFHMQVLGLEPESARQMLDRAAEESWTRGRLATAVTASRTITDPTTGETVVVEIPGIPTGRIDEDIEDMETPRRVSFFAELSPDGMDRLSDMIHRQAGDTLTLTLAQLLIIRINQSIGRTVLVLHDAQHRPIVT